MMGHLVLGRYGMDNEQRTPVTRETGWMTKVFRSLFRKRG